MIAASSSILCVLVVVVIEPESFTLSPEFKDSLSRDFDSQPYTVKWVPRKLERSFPAKLIASRDKLVASQEIT